MNLTELIKGNVVKFNHANEGILYYNIEFKGSVYQFPIDMNDKEDVGTGVFHFTEKAIFLMRWIRRAIENESLIQIV
jgi:hypothetical protein